MSFKNSAMQKHTTPLNDDEYHQNEERLQAIATSTFGSLSDEVVLELLAERRTLAKENEAYKIARDEAIRKREALTAEQHALTSELDALNLSITPDKDDDTLIKLVGRRKELEAELATLEQQGIGSDADVLVGTESGSAPKELASISKDKTGKNDTTLEQLERTVRGSMLETRNNTISVSAEAPKIVQAQTSTQDSFDGDEKIDANLGSSEAQSFLQLLRSNPDAALAQLETLPNTLRGDKLFMLQVARVDPAYAIHYADPKTLKKDEDFNIRIAAMENPRDSGNPLTEMLSEIRTSKVVMTAVQHDFRNLRYATPSMEGYKEMVEIAKEGARRKIRLLGQAIDVRVFLPRILREDRAFSEEVEGMMAQLKSKA